MGSPRQPMMFLGYHVSIFFFSSAHSLSFLLLILSLCLCYVRRERLLVAGLSDELAGLWVFCLVLLRCSLFGNSSALVGSASRSAAFSNADGLVFPGPLSVDPEARTEPICTSADQIN